jgi:hypothetical protein
MSASVYEIYLQEALEPRWADWFDGLDLTISTAGGTVLRGPLADKAALHSLLNRIYDLNLTMILVRRVEPDPQDQPGA